MIDAEHLEILRILYPYAHSKFISAVEKKTRFVHYTNAAAAQSIIREKHVWMRKSSCMNDFMEVQHGLNCLIAAYKSKGFRLVLDSLYDGFSSEIETLFNGWSPHFLADTYFTCVSEHEDDEDIWGRLSMWRAYSETTGIAFVLNGTQFLNAPNPIEGIYCHPVDYLDDKQFEKRFEEVINSVKTHDRIIRGKGKETAKALVFQMLRNAALCTKHPGFKEEKEWRVIYSPLLDKSAEVSKTKEIKAIKGEPQPIYKIPIKNISELIDRIIIGPTQYSGAVREAFIELMEKAAVKDSAKKVFISNIPLRR